MTSLPEMIKLHRNIIILGVVLVVIFGPLALGGFDRFVTFAFTQMLRLREGTDLFRLWRDVPIPIYLSFYFFNITNADKLKSGERPRLQEIGPYVYIEKLQKEDLSFPTDDRTVRYRQTRHYYFQPQLTKGRENDTIVFINLLFVALAKMAHDFTDVDFLLEKLDTMLSEKGETLTVTATIRELMFDGVSIQTYLDLFNDPLVQAAAEGTDLSLPPQFADGKFGLLKDKNGSDDGWYEVSTATAGDPSELGKIVKYNDQSRVKAWRGGHCNDINGTDGTIFPPFITKDTVVTAFGSSVCRSLTFVYKESGITDGIPTMLFNLSPKNFQNPKNNPDNWCFAPKPKNESDDNTWPINGLFSLEPCVGAPLLISYPHFIGVDDWVGKAVDGLHPNPEKHVTRLNFHLLTGFPVEASARMQFSIELYPWPAMPTFADVHHCIFPFAWAEESAILDPPNLKIVKMIEAAYSGGSNVINAMILLGVVMISAGAGLAYKQRMNSPVSKVDMALDVTIVAPKEDDNF